MSSQCVKRLQKEYKDLKTSPNVQFDARPDDSNILLWYYVVRGTPDSPYAGGQYLGKIRFKNDYPFSPPRIMMTTPSGRFETETRLCLSISDYHPEEWNPMWNIRTILLGLISFMNDDLNTLGSVESTNEEKAALAAVSHRFNVANVHYKRLFPKLYEVALKTLNATIASPPIDQTQPVAEETALQ